MKRRPVRLDRHEIDRVARAVATGRRGLGARLDAVADAIAARMTAKLAAAGVAVARPARRSPGITLDRETRDRLLERVSRHVPVVHEAIGHGAPHPG